MVKPKSATQAGIDYDKKREREKRRARQLARGFTPVKQPEGSHERAYQDALEQRGQLRLFA
jgi:hypothetical protein